MLEHHISVARTARYFTLGEPGQHIRQLWFVMHGYGYSAARFLRAFRPLDDGSRLIVAPEGLSRFYVSGNSGHVGASWMTKEDRLAEIDDYVAYLDAVYRELSATIHGDVIALGFSQGTATAARWACLGTTRIQRLIEWGGLLPPELDGEELHPRLRELPLTFVWGTSDQYANPERHDEQRDRLHRHNLPFNWIEYDGGHRIDEPTLMSIAG